MAIEKRFRETLESNIRLIKQTLLEKVKVKFQKIREEKLDNESVKQLNIEKNTIQEDIDTKRNELDKTINELREQYDLYRLEQNRKIDAIQIEIDKALPLVSEYSGYEDSISEKADSVRKLVGFNTRYNGRSSKLYKLEEEALEEIADSKEMRSLENFEKIREHTINLFNMAATNVEARGILLAFQNKNWTAMGVNLPTINMTESFIVSEDGDIVMKALGDGT